MPQLTRLLPRRRYAVLLALLLISSLLISALLFALTHRSKPDTLLLTRALDDCLSAESYSYQCRSTVTLGGDATERVFSVFSGEKAGESRHVWGSILGTTVNLYFVDGVLYQQNAVDGSWHSISGQGLAQAALLLGEIDPTANFAFTEMGEAEYLGKEEVEGRAAHQFLFTPQLKSEWIRRYFTDICYRMWVDVKTEQLVKADITATSIEDPTSRLHIENYFADYGSSFIIEPPQ
ncbi:MAG: hypothetical protein IKC76_00060 [Firmicutes bacterium]|nr:hypothetical protein [Bacillota bacterium]MBR7112888.1 hypothetical protein [Bacillota bacterium]